MLLGLFAALPVGLTGCAAEDVLVPLGIAPATPPQAAAKPGVMLVVFTYGLGAAGTGPGKGLRDVADAIRKQYPQERVITRGWDDHDDVLATIEKHRGPVALVGHSFGGCRTIEIARRVHRTIDSMVLLDPVPCEDWGWRHAGRYFEVPPNVRKSVCYFRPPGIWPISYPILNPQSPSDNRLRELGHAAICESDDVRQYILGVCGQNHLRQ